MSNQPIKVVIAVLGRFHAFNLAQQMLKHGALEKLITSFPKFEVVKYGIPRHLLQCCPWQEVLMRSWWKMPSGIRKRWNTQYYFCHSFDRYAARKLREGADIFVGLSGSSLMSLKRAKSLGMTTVVERGSSHMLYQQQVLKEEYARIGLNFNETHPAVIEQELAEYEEADYISIPSEFVKRSFLQYGVSEHKLIHNPYGVSLTQFNPEPKKDNVFRVIQCGAVSLQKGIPYLLEAFTSLDLPNSELWLVGHVSDEIRPILDRFARPNIVVHGSKPQAQLAWFYSQADVCCLMSVQDGFGMVLCQAMSCGLPLICTTNTGGDDLISEEREGFVVPIRDVEALKKKLLWCYENRKDCQEMGKAARQKVQHGFTWDDYGDRMLAEYQRIRNPAVPKSVEVTS
jgi:hypothetical protein